MSTEFWVGIFLSIPIGILTSLITPWIQRKLDESGKQRALTQSKNIKAELTIITQYKNDPTSFSQYLLHIIIRTTFIGSVIGIVSGVLFAFGQLLNGLRSSMIMPLDLGAVEIIRNMIFFCGQLVVLMGAIMIVNTCRPALSKWTKVHNFDEFQQRAKAMGA